MLINLIGFKEGNLTGYGIHTNALWESLQKIKGNSFQFIFTELKRISQATLEKNIAICRNYPGKVVNIWLQVGPGTEVLKLFPGIKVAYTVFETDVLSRGWPEGLNQADYVFTASSWGRQIMINCGVDYKKIKIIPEGVDPNVFHPWGGTIENIDRKKFNFLMIGKYEKRKGQDELIEAFSKIFKNYQDVQLLLKADSFIDPEAILQLKSKIKAYGCNNIKILSGKVDNVFLASLYRSCDAFVFPSKGEGWGLPLIEAIACGLPVVTTYCTGHSEYLKCIENHIEMIDTKLEQVPFDPQKYPDGFGNWYAPLVDSIADGLKRCVERGKQRNLLAAEIMISNFSWDASARKLLKIVSEF